MITLTGTVLLLCNHRNLIIVRCKFDETIVHRSCTDFLLGLNEKDDVEAYLVTFRRIMEAHNILEDRWPHYLTSQLTGKAQLLFLLQIVGITRKLKRQFSSGMGLTRNNTGGDFGWRGERTGRRTES